MPFPNYDPGGLSAPPGTRHLSDDERNVLASLAHEACEAHCVECGRCDWEYDGHPDRTVQIEMTFVTYDESGDPVYVCPDCSGLVAS
jgi:hypothetical protein